MRFEDATAQLRPRDQQRVDLADFRRRCRRPGSRRRAADRSVAGHFAGAAMRGIPGLDRGEGLGVGVEGGARGNREHAGLALPEQWPHQRFRPASASCANDPAGRSACRRRPRRRRASVDQHRRRLERPRPTARPPGRGSTAIQPALQPSTPTNGRRRHATPAGPAPDAVRWRSCTIAIGCDRLCGVGLELQLVAAALGRARQDLVHRRRGRLQRLGDRLAGEHARQKHRRGQVAQPVGRPVDEAVLGKQRLGRRRAADCRCRPPSSTAPR